MDTHTHTLTIAKGGKVKGALKTGSRNGTTHASIIEEMGAWTGEERGGGWVRDKGEGGRIGRKEREGREGGKRGREEREGGEGGREERDGREGGRRGREERETD